MVPSPKVATSTSSRDVGAGVNGQGRWRRSAPAGYDLIVLNYANPDMVGHTGSLAAPSRQSRRSMLASAALQKPTTKAGGALLVTRTTAIARRCAILRPAAAYGSHHQSRPSTAAGRR